MLNAMIVDNEESGIEMLKLFLEKTGRINITGCFFNSNEALSNLKVSKYDVAFLEIEIQEINGLELARKILALDENIEIVFVSAQGQYALDAFRVNALDYILRPLTYEVVEQSAARLFKRKGILTSGVNNNSEGCVYCFGKITVYGPGSKLPVKWRTTKAEELFAYMLQHLDSNVSKWNICEALWPEFDTGKVDIYLHTTIYKMKKDLSSANIPFYFSFINGGYLMRLPGVYIDTVEFDAIMDFGNSIPIDMPEKYERAFSLYKNNYLEGNDYIWSLPKSEEYFKKWCLLAEELARYYMKKDDYTSSERILRKALVKSPLCENLHELLLKLYFVKKDRIAFITHYKNMEMLFSSELGIDPSDSIKALYQAFIKLD